MTNRMSYPDGCFSYTGAIDTRFAVIAPSPGADRPREYAVFDAWVTDVLDASSRLCVGWVPVEVLAPIIFSTWKPARAPRRR